ncbi:hypothetical protein [uncultured Vibrio sp.]|uniref:hypothetical protein n=1 Tax=uncultured Vibrio sp. TaxID=114054 RepID=UPI0025F8C3CC|nr:hypothetical protein [uncultured Vibrio sp.]
MKTLLAILVTGLLSFSVHANSGTGNMGDRVDCTLPQGDMDYIPVEMCRMKGGSW